MNTMPKTINSQLKIKQIDITNTYKDINRFNQFNILFFINNIRILMTMKAINGINSKNTVAIEQICRNGLTIVSILVDGSGAWVDIRIGQKNKIIIPAATAMLIIDRYIFLMTFIQSPLCICNLRTITKSYVKLLSLNILLKLQR